MERLSEPEVGEKSWEMLPRGHDTADASTILQQLWLDLHEAGHINSQSWMGTG